MTKDLGTFSSASPFWGPLRWVLFFLLLAPMVVVQRYRIRLVEGDS
jgi:hypothetical protein